MTVGSQLLRRVVLAELPALQHALDPPLLRALVVQAHGDPENDDRLPGQPKQFKLRLPFPSPVVERKDVKAVIVEMTQASAAVAKED